MGQQSRAWDSRQPGLSSVRGTQSFQVAARAPNTTLGWNSVPATRWTIAMSSVWLRNTLTNLAEENSGRFTGLPLSRRGRASGGAVTEGKPGKRVRGWRKYWPIHDFT